MTTDHVNRKNVITELVETESKYVNLMFKLVDNVINPIRAVLFPDAGVTLASSATVPTSKFISEEDFRVIFDGLLMVLEANKNFFPQVAQKLTSWSESQTVGDVFLEWSHWFKLYRQYCNNFDRASHAFSNAVNKSKKFAQFIEDAMPKMNYQTVQSVMISPIQRIPRYLLLLKELLKCTGIEHPDAALLSRALNAMSATASELDLSLGDQESAVELFCIVTKFRPIPELDQPTPGLVKLGNVVEETSGAKPITIILLKNSSLLLGGIRSSSSSTDSQKEKEQRHYKYVSQAFD